MNGEPQEWIDRLRFEAEKQFYKKYSMDNFYPNIIPPQFDNYYCYSYEDEEDQMYSGSE